MRKQIITETLDLLNSEFPYATAFVIQTDASEDDEEIDELFDSALTVAERALDSCIEKG